MQLADKIRELPVTEEFFFFFDKEGMMLKNLHSLGLVWLLSELVRRRRGEKPLLLLTPSPQENRELEELLKGTVHPIASYATVMIPELRKEILPQILTSQMRAQSILKNSKGLVLASVADLVLPGFTVEEGTRLVPNLALSPQTLVDTLIELGYSRVDNAVQPLDLAWRGDTLELFEPHRSLPLKIEFFGDKIERLGFFDPLTKAWQKEVKEIQLAFWQKNRTLTSFLERLPIKPYLFLLSPEESFEIAKKILLTEESLQRELAALNRLIESLKPVEIESLATTGALNFGFQPAPIFAENWPKLVRFLAEHGDYEILLASRHNPKLLEKFIQEAGLSHVSGGESAQLPVLKVLAPLFKRGFLHRELKTTLLTDHELFRQEPSPTKSTSLKTQKLLLAELRVGDYVVHSEHGVGILKAFQKMTVDKITRDYLVVEYAQNDVLYVPVEQIDKITKFIREGGEIKLNRLSNDAWKKSIAGAKKDTLEFAKELLKLYAKRSLAAGVVYPQDDFWEEIVGNTFAYEETPDQARAIEEVYRDLESGQVMDRLLVADVGFGKTEVALRAASKVISAGYQVALLAPTTILVEQHLKTFKNRLEPLKIRLAALSRFQSKTEQKELLAQLKAHQLDLIIGTHRLLSKDVGFAKLGLLIIDEEQRFGVRQKERLKEMRSSVNVLSMTATPIPRTLNLALSGIRDITVIETPPLGRVPIETSVLPLDWQRVKKAIREEVERGGQVYFVHNRVHTIPTVQHRLETLLPEVRFIAAHGQMPEKELAGIMEKFYAGEFDVLVASTIIENGLDNPRVNTLIIDDASRFGLSQLHQLRGRIGRSHIQAKAYFFYHRGSLTPKMIARLKTIAEETTLGSGMNIALKDMKIRGTGGILSTRQHGHIQAVGLPMYLKLLAAAIEEIKTGTRRVVETVTLDLPVSAFIPVTYIDQESSRIKLYQRLALAGDEKELFQIWVEMEKDYGPPPTEIKNLLEIIKLKIRALKSQMIKSIRAVKPVAGSEKREVRGGTKDHIVTFELIHKPQINKQILPAEGKIEGDKLCLTIDFGNLEKAFRELNQAVGAIAKRE